MTTAVADVPTVFTDLQQSQDLKRARYVEFMRVYEVLREELLSDEIITGQPAFAQAHLKRMLNYNVPGGKLIRGMTVADVLRAIKQSQTLSTEELFKANTLGWCIEWLQAFFLVADDIMDHSITRRGQPCWYKQPDIGLMACNDYILLDTCMYRILQRHFKGSPQYADILDLFHETTHQTAHGQLLDTLTAPIGTVDLSRYTIETYMRIVTYKTAFYSFYLPVACGLVMAGRTDAKDFEIAKEICLQMGQYFQIQDDYLDCYGDAETIGKIGTDIKDNKCSWLIVQALDRADDMQKKVIEDNYGKDDASAEAQIKALYNELGLQQAFFDYEQQSFDRLNRLIQEQKQLPEPVFLMLLRKIYKRSK